ncbi:hypothetical protein F511_41684 [Dorcoceras hygrometricum]|uniref:Uncharacterized protein n=1 Tax=Dorcoceras hygrometricum TaxID=472368 RepID=A0A2Z7AKG8_9LAMI|nr:hypothetical protein F511_41684 [Dorcoceras hygrometricum]
MASSLISNTNQVHFASVLAMDNAGMVAMFEALVASGLNDFLGSMSDIFETALVEFYQNSSVRDGKVISTVQRKLVEISEELELVSVAQESIPLQIVAPIPVVPAVLPPRADIVDKGMSTADDVDHIIEQVVVETTQMDTDVEGTDVSRPDVGDQEGQRTNEMEHWLNISYEEFVAREADRMIESGSDTNE